jgi:hypothetical protein
MRNLSGSKDVRWHIVYFIPVVNPKKPDLSPLFAKIQVME